MNSIKRIVPTWSYINTHSGNLCLRGRLPINHHAHRMVLKYSSHLQKCKDQPCPCAKHAPRGLTAFRFMCNNPATEDPDFVPQALTNGRTPTPKDKCGRFGLSFFTSLREARRFYHDVLKPREDAAERRAYMAICEVELTGVDGLSGLPRNDGHFNLHPADSVLFAGRVKQYHTVEE